jgi:hypothetical protein
MQDKLQHAGDIIECTLLAAFLFGGFLYWLATR